MNKARITYRFDQSREKFDRISAGGAAGDHGTSRAHGPDGRAPFERDPAESDHDMPTHEAKPMLHDSQMLNPFTTDYGAWSSPFDMETERLERLIRESSYPEDVPLSDEEDRIVHVEGPRRSGERAERRDGQSRRVDADEEGGADEWESGPIIDERLLAREAPSSSRPGGYSWFGAVASIAGAIATGVLFGLFVMQLFTNLMLNSEVPPVTDRHEQTDAPPVSLPGDDTAVGPDVEARATAVSLPSNTVYMLQYGVFSSADGAYAAIDQLQKAGIASAYEAGERHIVYAGLTPDRNSALLLSNQLAGMNLETYVKTYERPAVQSLRWGKADGSRIEAYFSAGAELARTVSLLTLVHLEEKELTNFEDATIQALAASHQEWKMLAGELAKEVPEQAQEVYQRMNNALTTAAESLFAYRKNPAVSYLWQAQSAVMNYVIQEKSLLRELSA